MVKSASHIPVETHPFADRRRWTADDCEKMEAAGMLIPGEYELLDGVIVATLGRSVGHATAHTNVVFALRRVFDEDFIMLPVSIPISDYDRPERDALVTVRPGRDYLVRGNPTPPDIRPVIEVADRTLWRDLNTKAVLYGSAGVTDYWVADVDNRRLHVHRQPESDGYADVREYDDTQSVAPLAALNNPIPVANLLP